MSLMIIRTTIKLGNPALFKMSVRSDRNFYSSSSSSAASSVGAKCRPRSHFYQLLRPVAEIAV